MNNPDLLITWHESADYPLARAYLHKYRDFFGKIIIYFSKHFREPVFTSFLKESLSHLDNIAFLDPVEYKYGVEDWRNVSTHQMIERVTSEWVCSVEQDFFAKDWSKLFQTITEASKAYDLIGYKGYQGQEKHQDPYLTGDYVHPSFWFMKRETLEKTSKDFSADPKRGADHFGLITQDAERLQIPIFYLQDHGFKEWDDVFHLGGVNMNYLDGIRTGVFHRPEIFYVYNYWCRKAPVAQDPRFIAISYEAQMKMKEELPNVVSSIDPETSEWKKYFVL